jgi:hypothetical protein
MAEGWWRATGCQMTNCDTAVSILVGAKATIQNNDISFNGTAFSIDGEGVIEDNNLWGNFQDESPNAMDDAVIHVSTSRGRLSF